MKHRNLLVPIILVIMFVGPLVAATIAYMYRNDINFSSKSCGTLVTPTPIKFQKLYDTKLRQLPQPNNLNKWLLVYIADNECNTTCKQELKLLHNTHIALHKHSKTVVPALAYRQDININKLAAGNIIIVDPINNYMMRYTKNITAINAKYIIKDLKKLVKFPHVGNKE